MNQLICASCAMGAVAIASIPFPAIAARDTIGVTFDPNAMNLDKNHPGHSKLSNSTAARVPNPASPLSNSAVSSSAIAPNAESTIPQDSHNAARNTNANPPSSIVLNFTPQRPNISYPIEPSTNHPQDTIQPETVDPLIAIAIGHAEGTRTAAGDRTWAYYGHRDPGNGRWNVGSFSYQHCTERTPCSTPEEADARQIQRLRQQSIELQRQARAVGLYLTPEELLNGLDLANQAPLAALDRGYLNWLKQAQELGKSGSEAILWARVRSFIDPDTQQWNAPGLGNNIRQITADQQRRMDAIARVMQDYELKNEASLWTSR
jgi:hypothetical protein